MGLCVRYAPLIFYLISTSLTVTVPLMTVKQETVVNPEREVKEVSYPPSKAQCNGVKS